MPTITLNNIIPSTIPANGWLVRYRILGSGDPWTNASGNPYMSQPIVIVTADPPGTVYEGYIRPDCGDGNLGDELYWESANLIFVQTVENNESKDLTAVINGTFDTIDWGDGTINTSLTHTYVTGGQYTVKIYNTITTKFDLKPTAFDSYGVIDALPVLPNTVTNLNIYTSTIFSTLDSLTPNTALQSLRINNESNSSVIFPPVTLFTALTRLDYIGYNQPTIDLTNNTLLTSIEISDSVLTNIIGFSGLNLLNYVALNNSLLTSSVVNQILIDLDSTGITNGTVILTGQTPAAPPTGSGITAKNNLLAKNWLVNTD